ncbi:MAG: mandelate racemase/muconate lactonizing enzyme family protein [Promethearchaeota archaeon]|nr:MAG: mandelate racemase/muconate lactonizing enzyme family protein [Candidatus Lokiarchaeota archaeon]
MVKMNSEIERIELTPLHVPFKPYVINAMSQSEGGLGMAIGSEEAWLGGDFVICKLYSKSAKVGLGESFVWLPESGVSAFQIIDSIKNGLSNYLIGENPFNIGKINHRMDINIARSDVAKGLLDMACYDLMGQILDIPACFLMGGKNSEEIPLAALIPLGDPMLMKGLVRSYFKKGFRTFRLKLGKGLEEDREIISTIRKTFGEKIRIRVDFNQSYAPSKAVQVLKMLEPFQIDYAEQPVAADDYLGLAYVQKSTSIPLMVHEGFFSLKDFVTLVELGAVRVLGLNSERPGGVSKAIIALNYAKMKGLEVVLHNQPLGIASAMHIHFHSAFYNDIDHPTELFGQEMLQDDLITNPIKYHDGKAEVPKGAGWGVKLDEKALQRFATDDTTIIES